MKKQLWSLVLFAGLLLLPAVAFAQVASGGDSGGILGTLIGLLTDGGIGPYLLILLAGVELAKRVVAVIPGKPLGSELGTLEMVLRQILDLFAGKSGDPKDPSLIQR